VTIKNALAGRSKVDANKIEATCNESNVVDTGLENGLISAV